jgi:hypothetical protein
LQEQLLVCQQEQQQRWRQRQQQRGLCRAQLVLGTASAWSAVGHTAQPPATGKSLLAGTMQCDHGAVANPAWRAGSWEPEALMVCWSAWAYAWPTKHCVLVPASDCMCVTCRLVHLPAGTSGPGTPVCHRCSVSSADSVLDSSSSTSISRHCEGYSSSAVFTQCLRGVPPLVVWSSRRSVQCW